MNFIKFIFLFQLMFVYSQTNRFVYQVISKSGQNEKGFRIENYYLDIDKEQSIYYNRLYYINDSITKKTSRFGFQGFRLTDFVVRKAEKCKEYKMINFKNLYLSLDEKQSWKIEKQTEIFHGRPIQKATTYWGGRDWIAWFDTEIPFPFGPYVFEGLPGLIVKLEDSKKDFQFELITSTSFSSTQKIDFLETLQSGATTISLKQYHKLMLDAYKAPFAFIKQGFVQNNEEMNLRLEDGSTLNNSNFKEKEEMEQKKMRDANHPIHLEQKIEFIN